MKPQALATTFTLYADGDRSLPVAVARKRVKNLNLRVRPNGSVALSIPLRTSVATAQSFLDRRADWIRTHMATRTDAAHTPLVTYDAAGNTLTRPLLPLWGTLVDAASALELPTHALSPATADRLETAPVESPNAVLPCECPAQVGDLSHLGRHVEARRLSEQPDWPPQALSSNGIKHRIDALYRDELDKVLPDIVRATEGRMGVHATRWSLRAMTSRWGSCTPRTGAIRINTALAAYPVECLEFVVAHELVHFMEPTHNRRFHTLLDIYCPENRRYAQLLKRPAADIAATRAQTATVRRIQPSTNA